MHHQGTALCDIHIASHSHHINIADRRRVYRTTKVTVAQHAGHNSLRGKRKAHDHEGAVNALLDAAKALL